MIDRLAGRVPFLSRFRKPRFSRAEVLQGRPFRNPLIEWEIREPEADAAGAPVAVLRVPRRQDRWGRLLNRLIEAPPFRQVVLDELGTDVWQACDGATTVEALIRELARKHRLERREVELSLTAYLSTLARRGFIGVRLRSSDGPGEERG